MFPDLGSVGDPPRHGERRGADHRPRSRSRPRPRRAADDLVIVKLPGGDTDPVRHPQTQLLHRPAHARTGQALPRAVELAGLQRLLVHDAADRHVGPGQPHLSRGRQRRLQQPERVAGRDTPRVRDGEPARRRCAGVLRPVRRVAPAGRRDPRRLRFAHRRAARQRGLRHHHQAHPASTIPSPVRRCRRSAARSATAPSPRTSCSPVRSSPRTRTPTLARSSPVSTCPIPPTEQP